MIKKVKGFEVGQVVDYDGVRAQITSFPTRTSVCLTNTMLASKDVKPYTWGTLDKTQWSTAKIFIKDLQAEEGKWHATES